MHTHISTHIYMYAYIHNAQMSCLYTSFSWATKELYE